MACAKHSFLIIVLLLPILHAPSSLAAASASPSHALVLDTASSWDEETLERVCRISIGSPNILMMQIMGGLTCNKIKLSSLLGKLKECHNCPLDRLDKPEKRCDFENKIIDDLRTNHPDPSSPLVLTSFASGELYQEFVLLNKIHHRGYFNITINLIDHIYAKHKELDDSFFKCDESQKSALWQFTNYFDSIACHDPRYTFRIQFYKSASDYAEDVKSGQSKPSDIIFNIDSSVYDLNKQPTSQIALDLAMLQKSVLHMNSGVIYTLSESSDKVLYALKTTAAGTTTTL